MSYEKVYSQHILVIILSVTGKGTITFRTCLPDSILDVQLQEALHIPALGANLISLGSLQHAKATINGLTYSISLAWNGREFLHANLIETHGTLYRIAIMTLGIDENNVTYIAS